MSVISENIQHVFKLKTQSQNHMKSIQRKRNKSPKLCVCMYVFLQRLIQGWKNKYTELLILVPTGEGVGSAETRGDFSFLAFLFEYLPVGLYSNITSFFNRNKSVKNKPHITRFPFLLLQSFAFFSIPVCCGTGFLCSFTHLKIEVIWWTNNDPKGSFCISYGIIMDYLRAECESLFSYRWCF